MVVLIGLGGFLCLVLVWLWDFFFFKSFCLFLWSHWLFVIVTSCFCNLFWPKDGINTSLSQSRVPFFALQAGDGTPQ